MGEKIDLDLQETQPVKTPVIKEEKKKESKKAVVSNNTDTNNTDELVSCLRNETIIVRRIPKSYLSIDKNNKKHVLSGGMAETTFKSYVVPKLTNGTFVNVLTDQEKAFLEDYMGLEYNALSVYNRKNNYWDDDDDFGRARVYLYKQDNYFDLSNPDDYIKYKILLANKNFICPSLRELEERPKETYEFVIISDGETENLGAKEMDLNERCYMEYGKYSEDPDILKLVVEILDNKTLGNTKLNWLKGRINELIKKDAKKFLAVITDPYLKTKLLIKNALGAGILMKRNEFYYIRESGTPLCENNEESTLNNAARYLNNPKHQDIRFTIEAKLNEN